MLEPAVDERVRTIVATLFNVPVEDIGPQSSPETIENWDSMGHLMLTLELEQQFGVQIPPEDVEKMTSVAAIEETLSRCGVAGASNG